MMMVDAMNMAKPIRQIGLRPFKSEKEPPINCPKAAPNKYVLRLFSTKCTLLFKEWATSVMAGKYVSMEKGMMATSMASNSDNCLSLNVWVVLF